MRLPLRALALVSLGLLSSAFDWPGQLEYFAYELRHADPARKRDVAALVAQDSSKEATELLLRSLEEPDDSVRIATAQVLNAHQARAALPVLRDLCTDPSVDVRAAAVAAVARSAEEAAALPLLLRALSDVDGRVRHAAASGLQNLESPSATPALVEALRDPDPETRLAAAKSLGNLGDRSVAPLLAATLSEGDATYRRAVVESLGDLGSHETVPALAERLGTDDDEDVRVLSALALGKTLSEDAEALLLQQRKDADGRVAEAILAALGHLNTVQSRQALLALVGDPTLGESAIAALHEAAVREQIQRSAPVSLVRSKDEEPATAVVGLVNQALSAVGRLPTSDDATAARAVGRLFAAMGEVLDISSAGPLLIELLSAHKQPDTAWALAHVPTTDALVALLDALSSEDERMRSSAIAALDVHLSQRPDTRAADPLIGALVNASPSDKAALCRLLGKTGAKRAAQSVVPLLKTDDQTLQRAVLEALTRLSEPSTASAILPLLQTTAAPAVRHDAARALGRSANGKAIRDLIPLLSDPGYDSASLLEAIEVAMARGTTKALSKASLAALLERLGALATEGDEATSYAAIEALAAHGQPAALATLGVILREPSDDRRLAAAMGLRHYDAAQARPLLRFLLRNAAPEIMLGALLSVAEVGDRRDLSTVMVLSQRTHYPLPAAVPYVIGRWIERQAIPARMAERALCTLMERDEALLRTNAAAALAHAAAGPCADGGQGPTSVLELSRTASERRALARWLLAAQGRNRLDPDAAQEIRAKCALYDPDAEVRRICLGRSPQDVGQGPRQARDLEQGLGRGLPILITTALGEPLRKHLVGAQLTDSSVYLGVTSPRGTLQLPSAATAQRVLDPGLMPIAIPNATTAPQASNQESPQLDSTP